ncbi:hypothetical protein [Sphingomonas phage Kimi]|nr:hypothetical protein [Sphingomonas phage Kimi]
MSINGHFAQNMTGKTVKFDVQPYERGTGVIKNMIERSIRVKDFCPRRGTVMVEYVTYDLEIEVVEGSKTGALYGGVPVKGTVKDAAGSMTFISGVNYGDIYRAVEKGETIIIARCG